MRELASRRRPLIALGALLTAPLLVAGPTHGAPRMDSFLLGQSAQSGAVCKAQRDYDDPAAQVPGGRAWKVDCRGWPDASLGHLYAFIYDGKSAIGPKGAWGRSLSSRAECGAPKPETLAGLRDVSRRACKGGAAKTSYVAYVAARGGAVVAAEGFAQIADTLEAGLKIVAGADRPPTEATRTQTSSAPSIAVEFGGQLPSLSEATSAARLAPESLYERGYIKNHELSFEAAETDFRALARDPRSSAQERTEAYLNWALNTSNNNRFQQADILFAEADRQAASSDPATKALALLYRALHYRNEGRLTEALATAEAARAALQVLAPTAAGPSGTGVTRDATGAIVVDGDVAAALRSRMFASNRLTPAQRVRVRLGQALYVAGSLKAQLGQTAAARQEMLQGRAVLSEPGLVVSTIPLRAQVDVRLAELDLGEARPQDARARLQQALTSLRAQQSGSPAEALLMLELAKAEAAAGDRARAMADYSAGLTLMRGVRGSLGESTSAIGSYFDILLERSAANPADAENAERFFAAAGSVSTSHTAETVAQLSGRLADSSSAGLARALEDTRRQIVAKQSELAEGEGQKTYPAAQRAATEAALKSLEAQLAKLNEELIAANPRYGTVITSSRDLTLKELQAKLRPGEVYAKIVLLDDAGYGLAVTHDTFKPYKIAVTKTNARRRVDVLRHPFVSETVRPFDVAASYELFQILFGPVRDTILSAKHLIYEPDQAVLSFPVAAFVTDPGSVKLMADRRLEIRRNGGGELTYTGVKWLGATAETSLVTSAGSFLQARAFAKSPAKRPFLGYGAPQPPSPDNPHAFAEVDSKLCESTRAGLFAMRPLNDAALELTNVARVLGADEKSIVTGPAFTDAAVVNRTDLGEYRVIYFATHGILPQTGGCLPEPVLITSVADKDSDGLLDTQKILGLQLQADLVVLSACDTGGRGSASASRTGLIGGGESLAGLARAFIYAGARSLLVSHWEADSKGTARLMAAMFQSRARTQAGALRSAVLELMNSPDSSSHPYYWAAFTIVGDGAREMPAARVQMAQAN